MDFIMERVFNEVYSEGFVSSKELKERFLKALAKYHIDIHPKATLIEKCKMYNAVSARPRINGVQVRGYILSRFK